VDHLDAIGRDARRASSLAAAQLERVDRMSADLVGRLDQPVVVVPPAPVEPPPAVVPPPALTEAPPPPPAAPPPPTLTERLTRWPILVAAAVAVGAAGAGAYYGSNAVQTHEEAQRAAYSDDAERALLQARGQATTANILFGVAGGATAAGAVFFFTF
jgi:hypothetical protein